MAEVSTPDASHATTLMTGDEATTRSNLMSSKRHQAVAICTIQDLTCASPFSNTSSDQSDGIFCQRVFHETERDSMEIAAVNRPQSLIVAAKFDPRVQATVTKAALTAGKHNGPGSLSIAAAAGGKMRKRRKARKAPKAWQD